MHIPANAMYMVTDKGIVLFDTPWDKRYYQPLLDSLWKKHHKKVILCVSTHYHDDRTGGLEYYNKQGVKTYTTYMTDSLSVLHDNNRAKFILYQDTVFHLGRDSFITWYPGPGHTTDNIVIWFPRQKVLYGGCLVKSVSDTSLGNLEDANVKEWASSLHRLQKRFPHPRYIIVGHNSWKDKQSILHTLKLIAHQSADL
jgi:metallo-beta-lactamase class B